MEEREAEPYDEAVVKERDLQEPMETLACGCSGSHVKSLHRNSESPAAPAPAHDNLSKLMQWPVQIKLAPTKAAYFTEAKLLIAADCTAFAHGDFHNQFI